MEYSQQEEEMLYQQQLRQQGQQPQLYQPPPPGKDSEFLQWLFNLKRQILEPLAHSWRGEIEVEPGKWQLPKNKEDRLALMNERGISWGISQITEYLNPAFIISNYDEEQMNWTMRGVGRTVWNGLCQDYKDYGLKRIDIPRVSRAIIHKIHAILLGARGNGYREFFAKTHQVSEIRSTQLSEGGGAVQPQRRGIFGIFKKQQQQGTYPN